MSVLYVASDQDGAGKTAVCATLAHLLSRRGMRVTTLKPLTADADTGVDGDAGVYEKLLDQRQPDGWPLDAEEGDPGPERLESIRGTVATESEGADVTLIEGSCRLSAEATARVAEAVDARVLLVLRHRGGQSGAELKEWQQALGDRLLGSIVNGMSRYAGTDTRDRLLPSLDAEGLRPIGVVPEDRTLLGVSVEQLAQQLGGRFIACQEKADALVEHFMVGGYGMDPGELTFQLRDNKAVIVRGDRPDVQMSALVTPTACLILTKGVDPIEYVKYEAEQEEVSVMVVETDTLTTMDAMSSVIAGARFDHPRKLARFGELLEEHVDLAQVWRGLGVDG